MIPRFVSKSFDTFFVKNMIKWGKSNFQTEYFIMGFDFQIVKSGHGVQAGKEILAVLKQNFEHCVAPIQNSKKMTTFITIDGTIVIQRLFQNSCST